VHARNRALAGGRKPRFDGASRTTISLPMVDIKISVYLL
jgi:hypothetical protein